MVKVKMYGILKKYAGLEEIEVPLNNRSIKLKSLLDKLFMLLPKGFKDTLIDPELNNPKPNIIILINDKEISVLNELETIVRDTDEVTLLPVAHGGASFLHLIKSRFYFLLLFSTKILV